MNWMCLGWNVTDIPTTKPKHAGQVSSALRGSDLFIACCLLHVVLDSLEGKDVSLVTGYCNFTKTHNSSIRDYSSPFYPKPYPNNADCIDTLKVEEDHIIELEFRGRFNIEGRDCHMLRSSYIPQRPILCYCQYDFLELWDGPFSYSPLIGKFCGTIYPPNLRTTTRHMRVRFKSDDAIQYEGFYFLYKSVPSGRKRDEGNRTGCYIRLNETKEGMVNSSSIPKRFVSQATNTGVPLDCIFEIKVPNATQILLRFVDLKLVNPDDCDMDFVDVHQSSFGHRLQKYCGGHRNHTLINSSKAILRFMSDPKKLDENLFIAYYTPIRQSTECQEETDFDCGDGTCVSADLVCNKRENCLNRADEAACESGFGWKKTTLQSVIISIVVGIIIVGILAVAIYLTCNEKQISQPRRYFAPAPLHKSVATDEFGFGCTVDEMFARSKEEELGYFVRKVQGPIVENIPMSKLVNSHSSCELLDNVPNGNLQTNSLPQSNRRAGRHHTKNVTIVESPLVQSYRPRAESQSPARHNRRRAEQSRDLSRPDDERIDLHTSLRTGVPVFLYSPNTKRKLTRVA